MEMKNSQNTTAVMQPRQATVRRVKKVQQQIDDAKAQNIPQRETDRTVVGSEQTEAVFQQSNPAHPQNFNGSMHAHMATSAQSLSEVNIRADAGKAPYCERTCNIHETEAHSTLSISINACPTAKAEVRNLRKLQNEWEQQDYAYFTEQFNLCTHLKDIKNLVGLERQKDIGAICMKCDLLGLPIDKEKMKDIFLNESSSRWCSRILKVGKNRCLRISDTMTSQCGLELREGQQFEFSYIISQEGKKVIFLTMLE